MVRMRVADAGWFTSVCMCVVKWTCCRCADGCVADIVGWSDVCSKCVCADACSKRALQVEPSKSVYTVMCMTMRVTNVPCRWNPASVYCDVHDDACNKRALQVEPW